MSVWGLVGFAIGFLLVRVVRHFEVKRIRQENIRQLEALKTHYDIQGPEPGGEGGDVKIAPQEKGE